VSVAKQSSGRETRGWGRRGTAGATIPASLVFENITRSFHQLTALDQISLSVAPGEIVCLLGPSGCGKTTLLRIAAGIEHVDAGRVLIDGREVTSAAHVIPPEKRGVGLMFQDYALFPNMTILDNVLFGVRNLPRDATLNAGRSTLARMGLERFEGAYPHMLSGGEQQRAALARAIAPRPGILLMDEPFSNLDRRLRDSVRDETISVLREIGATAIIVTHDPEEAMRLADQIVLMRDGKIVQKGEGAQLYLKPENLFAARFFCDFNEITGLVFKGQIDTPIGLFPAPNLPDGTQAVVCIRERSIRLKTAGFCLPGRIVGRRCLGEIDLVSVAVQGLDTPLQARIRQNTTMPYQAVGQDVGVEIVVEECLVFPVADA
jgi:iron(III) transport system ATP-binding protein